MIKKTVVAADLGASGGKMAVGSFDGSALQAKDFYDFPNRPVELNGNLYWDLFSLYREILQGISRYAGENVITSVAVDTWGASYGLLDKRGRLLEPVYHYRDLRTKQSVEKMYQKLPKKELFRLTGCQPNRTYTLPQLYSYIEHGDPIIGLAKRLLFLPDLLEYFLCGEMNTERSIAGTSGLLKPEQDGWAQGVFEALGIPAGMMTSIVDAGTVRGTLLANAAAETGAGKAKVIAAAGHDTASAVIGIPGFSEGQIYISIGTNVNMGTELTHSAAGDKAFEGGFKNAGVMENRKILYRDFSAFWLLNELRRTWQEEGRTYDYPAILEMVSRENLKHVYIDVEDPDLNNAGGNMKRKINDCLNRSGQPALTTDGEFAGCILESIALKIKYCTEYLKEELGVPVHKVSVINGGSLNYVLMQMLSDALGMPVFCGLPYATLTGNILTQMYALGEVGSLEEIRSLSARSFAMREYLPNAGAKARWDADLQEMAEKGACR